MYVQTGAGRPSLSTCWIASHPVKGYHGPLILHGIAYLLLQQALHQWDFACPNSAQGCSSLQRLHPNGYSQTEREGCAEDDEPALCAEPASVGW
jgi:hypothetical protein